jgi:hypothetical protein
MGACAPSVSPAWQRKDTRRARAQTRPGRAALRCLILPASLHSTGILLRYWLRHCNCVSGSHETTKRVVDRADVLVHCDPLRSVLTLPRAPHLPSDLFPRTATCHCQRRQCLPLQWHASGSRVRSVRRLTGTAVTNYESFAEAIFLLNSIICLRIHRGRRFSRR